MRLPRTIILSLLLVLGLAGAAADTGRLYTSDQLSSSFVSCLAQSPHGFVWAGTGNGLNRFDGYHFRQYKPVVGDTSSLPHKIVTALFTDRHGTLWVGTGKGLAKYDAGRDCFVRVRLSRGGDDEPRVTQMAQASDGTLLVGTSGFGLFAVTEDGHGARRISRYAAGGDDSYYTAIHVDGAGRFWRGDNNGLVSCFSSKGRLMAKSQPRFGLPVSILDWHGGVAVVCKNGVTLFSKDARVTRRIASPFAISSAFAVRDGRLLLGTSHGVMSLDRDALAYAPFEIDNKDIDFSTTNVVCLFGDGSRNLWVSCAGRGLLFIGHGGRGFSAWSFSEQGVKTGGTITSVALAADGGVWVSLRGAKLYHFTPQGRIDRQIAAPEGLTFVYRDRQGRLWVGAGAALYRFDEASGHFTLYRKFYCDYVQSMSDDGRQHLFVSTFGHGMSVLSGGGERHYSMLQHDHGRGTLCNDWIFSFLYDSRGLLWIATSYGLACYDPSRDTFASFGGSPCLLPGTACLSIAEDGRGDIVIGTERGLYLYDRRRGKAAPFPHAGALAGSTIASIIVGSGGDLWCSSSDGLWHYRRKDGKFIGHINDAGIRENEFTENAGAVLPDGRLIFGSNNALAVFAPSDIVGHIHTPLRPVLTSLYIAGQPVGTADLSFGYQDNTFTMEFSNFDFAAAGNTVLEYRLDDDAWSQVARGENSVTFSHLYPGTYRLGIRAVEDGRPSPASVYTLTVRAPWYRTTLAYIIYVLLLLAIGYYAWWRYRDRWRQRLAMERLQTTIDDLMSENRKKDSLKEATEKYGAQVERRDITGNDQALIDRIMKSVNKNMGDSDYTVEQMASDAGLSRSQLHRKMKELTGVAPSDFLRTLRLQQAARLLREGDVNVTQVAYAVGFNSLNTFTKAFKQHFGQSPTEYAGGR